MSRPLPPSLKSLPQECAAWLERTTRVGDIDRYTRAVGEYLDAPGPLSPKVGTQLGRISHFWSVAACDAYFHEDQAAFARFFCWTVESRALLLRWDGMHSQMHPQLGNWPTEFSDSLRAAGPTILGDWATGRTCIQRYVEMAQKDEQLNTHAQSRRIAHNTHDVFLLELLPQAYGIATDVVPRKPLNEAYQNLLDAWQTLDQDAYAQAMGCAADFHVSRSKPSTGARIYEFDRDFDRVFPVELLAVAALRRRDGLPDFPTGHALVDEPWAALRDLQCPPLHPLVATVLNRVAEDYPLFR